MKKNSRLSSIVNAFCLLAFVLAGSIAIMFIAFCLSLAA